MSNKKPSYIGMLNAISNGERRGYEFLSAWADATTNEEVAGLLRVVAIREAEHAWAFEKRLCELGYALIEKKDASFKKTLKLVRSEASDVEKFEKLNIGKARSDDEPDRLLELLADKSIDPQTGALLGRFIAEERDSGRLLEQARELAQNGSNPSNEALDKISRQLQSLTDRVNALTSRN
ncbi:MAG: ferritin family protein [Pseudomonadales bacterium]